MPSIAFPDPTQLGTQVLKLDGSSVKVTINGAKLNGMISKVSYGVTVEGVELTYALGDRKPTGKTPGNIKPGELELEFYADVTNAALALISATGLHFSDACDIDITADPGSSAGLAALTQALKGSARTITAKTCHLIGVSGSFEVGGAALKEPLKFQPLEYLFNGKAGFAGLLL